MLVKVGARGRSVSEFRFNLVLRQLSACAQSLMRKFAFGRAKHFKGAHSCTPKQQDIYIFWFMISESEMNVLAINMF